MQANPRWDAPIVALMFWFIRHDDGNDFEGRSWADLLEVWLKLLPCSGRFTDIQGQVVALEDLTAAEYVDSDRLDLDQLSLRAR